MEIYKPRLKKSITQRVNFFSIRVISAWNQLPEYVISASGINSFKTTLTDTTDDDMGPKRHPPY